MREPFLWGASISAHQTEGGTIHNDWWDFEQTTLAAQGIEPSGDAVDFWNSYATDFSLASEAGLNAVRLSVEWSRCEPRRGEYDESAFAHYRTILETAHANNLRICLTLWHFTLPMWAATKGGFLNADVRNRFDAFVARCAREFGDLIAIWVTINEPMVYLMESFYWGSWPPKKRSVLSAIRIWFTLRMIHRKSYRTLRASGMHTICIAQSVIDFRCKSGASITHRLRALWKSFLWNHTFFLAQHSLHDCIGINHYIVDYVDGNAPWAEKDSMGWEQHDEGLIRSCERYRAYNKPLYVLENGIATADDTRRVAFIEKRIHDINRIRDLGMDLRGYFHWSLIDNFEWDKGFSKQFGLIAVNRASMKRIPKPSLARLGAHAIADLRGSH